MQALFLGLRSCAAAQKLEEQKERFRRTGIRKGGLTDLAMKPPQPQEVRLIAGGPGVSKIISQLLSKSMTSGAIPQGLVLAEVVAFAMRDPEAVQGTLGGEGASRREVSLWGEEMEKDLGRMVAADAVVSGTMDILWDYEVAEPFIIPLEGGVTRAGIVRGISEALRKREPAGAVSFRWKTLRLISVSKSSDPADPWRLAVA